MASEIKVDTIVNAGGDNDTGIDLGTNDAVKIKIANAVKAEVDSSGHVKLDTIKGYTSAASISVVGEGGSTTTNLQQGLAKVYVEGTSDVALSKSFNISSGTDHATGDYSYALTASMDSANYSQPTSVVSGTNDRTARRNSARDAAGTMAIETSNARTNSATDQTHTATIHGDLA